MRWFGNLRTLHKILVGFAVLFLATAVVGGLATQRLGQLTERLRALYSRDFRTAVEAKNVEARMLEVRLAARGVLMADDAAGREGFARRVEEADLTLLRAFDDFERVAATADSRRRIEEVRTAHGEYIVVVRSAVQKALAGDRPTAMAIINRAVVFGDRITAALRAASEAADAGAKASVADADALAERARTILLSTVLVAAVLAFAVAWRTGRSIADPLVEAVATLEKVAEGDLAPRVTVAGRDEVGRLGVALNAALDQVGHTLTEVRSAATDVAAAAEQLSAAARTISAGVQEQAASLEETAASLEEVSTTIRKNADGAQDAAGLAGDARSAADRGVSVVDSATSAIDGITSTSRKIGQIIGTVDEIAFQTNILALNAAVEAARAGEQGRGFAVVASEVRELAHRSGTAAREIKQLIQSTVDAVGTGSREVAQSGLSLRQILEAVRRVSSRVDDIALASSEQAVGIDQVTQAVARIDGVTQASAAQTEQLSATAQGLSTQAAHLEALVARFHLPEGAEARAAAC